MYFVHIRFVIFYSVLFEIKIKIPLTDIDKESNKITKKVRRALENEKLFNSLMNRKQELLFLFTNYYGKYSYLFEATIWIVKRRSNLPG